MAKTAVDTLEATRQKLIKKLLDQKRKVEEQLTALGYDDKTPTARTALLKSVHV